jgi:hypothetical protein
LNRCFGPTGGNRANAGERMPENLLCGSSVFQ